MTATCVLLAAVAILLYPRHIEPTYNGRTLPQWIKVDSQNPGDREAREAITCITTSSAPVLLRWAFADTSPRFQVINKLPFFISRKPFLRPLLYRDNALLHAACAMRAFEIAGTNTVSAVPALAALMTDHNPQVTIDAIYLCSLIGPPAIPALRRAMTNPHGAIRVAAIGSLRRFGTNATEAIPDVVKALSDYDIHVRKNATNVLETLYPAALTPTAAP